MPDQLDLHAQLQRHFGFDQFRPGQHETIGHLMAGRSAAAVFPTGGGKSLCYQLPALLLPGVTLVVSPLIALMKDQIDALRTRGIAAARLDSSLSLEEYRDVMQQVRAGTLRLLYVAPERFNNERFRGALQGVRVSLFAVDEAHCISEWGHNFRPDYLKLATYARQFQAERVLALTATATEPVLEDICRVFNIVPEAAVRTGFYRPNLQVFMSRIKVQERDRKLLGLLQDRPPGPTIIYVTLQRTAEEVAQVLGAAGLAAKAYHAGMDSEQRAAVQDWFIDSNDHIVVATIAFGMGIDKANIRYVYHYNPPKSLENYSQEIGRAGRDGAESICQMLFCADDLTVLEDFVYGDTPTEEALHGMVKDLFSQGEQFDLSLYSLSKQYDIKLLVVRTLLTYLELEGYIEGGTPFYALYRFKPRMTSQEILSQFEGDRRDFLAAVFKQAKRGRTWFSLDAAEVAQAIGTPRDRIVRALEYLSQQEMLELETQGVRHRYHLLRRPDDLTELARELHARTLDREKREIERLRQVEQLVDLDGCQVSALAGHFAETLEQPCGHCTWCVQR